MRSIRKIYSLAFLFATISATLAISIFALPIGIYAENMEVKLPTKDGSDSFQVQDSDGTSLMDVLSNGNVGIGTTSPQGLLHLSDIIVNLRLTHTQFGKTWIIGGGPVGTDFSVVELGSGTRFLIKEGGNVGIGTGTPGPTGKLHVDVDGDGGGDLFVEDSGVNAGNVGIGTTSPASKLHVSATGNPDIKVTSTGAGWSPSLTFATTTDRWRMKRVTSGGFAIEDLGADGGSGDRLFIDNDGDIFMAHNGGNVGIGTTSPDSKLEVSGGDIRVTGGSFIDDGTTLNVPDYVFDDDYALKPLAQVKAYIQENKSLEGLPDMNDRKGWASLSMQDRDMKLLEKMEELTLYVIQLKDENEAMKASFEAVKAANNSLKQRVKTLEEYKIASESKTKEVKLAKSAIARRR